MNFLRQVCARPVQSVIPRSAPYSSTISYGRAPGRRYIRLANTLSPPPLPLSQRSFQTSSTCLHSSLIRPEPGTGITVHFQDSNGNLVKTVEANEGENLLDIAHEHDIDLEGACEGSLACSTCHVILSPEYYDKLPEPVDEENDMLDMAFGLTDT
ncbi:hypothetical protein FRB95_013670 [Tulasnella sp. JGI-2019a]|nr:hypothetical protein FRB95_013670 [Tulasnella sp. JGI-2019a]